MTDEKPEVEVEAGEGDEDAGSDSGAGTGLAAEPAPSPKRAESKNTQKAEAGAAATAADAKPKPVVVKAETKDKGDFKELSVAQTVARDAYSKLLLHACKHPSRPVMGVLLGNKAKGDEKSSSSDALVPVVEAVPLFHSYALAPMMEMSMMQIDEYCKLSGLEIVGCYVANERYDDRELRGPALKLANKILEHSAAACVILIDNSRIASDKLSPPFETLRWKSNAWRVGEAVTGQGHHVSSDAVAAVRQEIADGKEAAVFDFESHLDNPALPWLV